MPLLNRRHGALALLAAACLIAAAATPAPAEPEPADARQVLRGYMVAPKAIRAAVAKVKPAMVTIETVGGIEVGAGGREARREIGGLARPGEGPTTGIIVSADGHIVTSTYNFIRKPRIITVTLNDGSRYVAELLGRDQTRKLVMLKIDAENLTPARFIDPDDLRVGQWAISVGVGYGPDKPAISTGIVSAKDRIAGRAVQTDANLSPANYGGPLIDMAGRVIGIATPLNPKASGVGAGSEWYDSGIGFAATGHGLDPVFDRMKQGQTLDSGVIGVVPDPRPRSEGVKIARVAPGSPAAKADLKPGDIVTHINGQPVASLHDVKAAMNTDFVGDTITATWTRDDADEPFTAQLTLAKGPLQPQRPQPRPNPEQPAPSDKDDNAT